MPCSTVSRREGGREVRRGEGGREGEANDEQETRRSFLSARDGQDKTHIHATLHAPTHPHIHSHTSSLANIHIHDRDFAQGTSQAGKALHCTSKEEGSKDKHQAGGKRTLSTRQQDEHVQSRGHRGLKGQAKGGGSQGHHHPGGQAGERREGGRKE